MQRQRLWRHVGGLALVIVFSLMSTWFVYMCGAVLPSSLLMPLAVIVAVGVIIIGEVTFLVETHEVLVLGLLSARWRYERRGD